MKLQNYKIKDLIIIHDLNKNKVKKLSNILSDYFKINLKLININSSEIINYKKSLIVFFINQDLNIEKFKKENEYFKNTIKIIDKKYISKINNFIITKYNQNYNIDTFSKLLATNIFKIVNLYNNFDFNLTKKQLFKYSKIKDLKIRGLNFYDFIIRDKQLNLHQKFLLTLMYNSFLFLKFKFNKYYSFEELRQILKQYSNNSYFDKNKLKKGNILTEDNIERLIKLGYIVKYNDKFKLLHFNKIIKIKGKETKKHYFSYAVRYFSTYPYKYSEFVDNVLIYLLEMPKNTNSITREKIYEYTGLSKNAITQRLNKIHKTYRFLEISHDEYRNEKYNESSVFNDKNSFFTVLYANDAWSFFKYIGMNKITKRYWFNLIVDKNTNKFFYGKIFFNKKWNVQRYNSLNIVDLSTINGDTLKKFKGVIKKINKRIDFYQKHLRDNLKMPENTTSRNKQIRMLYKKIFQMRSLDKKLYYELHQKRLYQYYLVYSVHSKNFFESIRWLKKCFFDFGTLFS